MEKLVSNDEIVNKTLELVKLIKEDDVYLDYVASCNRLESDKELLKDIRKIKSLQKKYVKSAYLDKDIENELTYLKNKLNDNLLYKDYLEKGRHLNSVLKMMEDGINISLENILNSKYQVLFTLLQHKLK